MNEIILRGSERECRIFVGQNVDDLQKYLGERRALVITDKNVERSLGRHIKYEKIIIDSGEDAKTLQTVEKIYLKLLELGFEKTDYIVGFGGGIVCDITGFVAATYSRGMNCILVPTTLLSQVDAAIGGKNGVNLSSYKNIIGTIVQPNIVLCDLGCLKTLPKNELRNGFAEVIKHAVIEDAKLFELLEKNQEAAMNLDDKLMTKIVSESIKIKVGIVSKDEKENELRMKLNFGHSVGHAVEKVAKIAHGEAVAIGMVAEAKISLKRGLISNSEFDRLKNLIKRFGLPIAIKLSGKRIELIDAVSKDKKKRNGKIKMYLLNGIGKSLIYEVGFDEIGVALDDLS